MSARVCVIIDHLTDRKQSDININSLLPVDKAARTLERVEQG